MDGDRTESNITEHYSESEYNWLQWILQGVFHLLRIKNMKMQSIVNEEANKPPQNPPDNIRSKCDCSLMDDCIYRTHVLTSLSGQSESDVVIIYFHGGAYVMTLASFHFQLCADLLICMGRCAVYVAEYDPVPKATHKTLFQDAETLYRQIIGRLGADQKVVIMGDSAGGGIALNLTQRLAEAKARGDSIRQPDSLVLLSPWLDVSTSNPKCADLEKDDPVLSLDGLKLCGSLLAAGPPSIDLTDPSVSPVNGSLSGLPPVNVWTSTHDLLHPDSERLLERFKTEKIPTRLRYYLKKGLMHDFMVIVPSPDTNKEITDSIRFDCGIVLME